MGARRFNYAESYYFGNPGLYLGYFIGINDAGHVTFEEGLSEYLADGVDVTDSLFAEAETEGLLSRPEAKFFRARWKPNMYSVARMGSEIFSLGPDLDRVRTAGF